jgi:hypothetical protein
MAKRMIVSLLILAVALTVVSCQADTMKTPKVLADWSRGQQVAVSALNRPVGMLAENGRVHLVLVAADSRALHYVRLDSSGAIQVSQDLDVKGAYPTDPELLLHQDGSLSVLWTDNPDIPRALFVASLSRDGQLLSEARQLSPEGVRVATYVSASHLDGSFDIFWSNAVPSEGGLHHLRLSADAEVISGNRLLVENGDAPTAQVATDGMIHLAWVEEQELRATDVYYALFDPSTGEIGPSTRVGFYKGPTGVIRHTPVLGLDQGRVYLFWALEQRGGGLAGAGNADTYVVSFPLGEPTFTEARTVSIPGTAKPDYSSAAGSFPYQQLASAEAGWPTSLLYMPAILAGQRDEVSLFLVGEVHTRSQSGRQVVWAIMAGGRLKGYQLAAKVNSALRPTAVLDDEGNVHLAWLNSAGFGRYEVYYASTSEAVKASLDRVTMQDRTTDFMGAVWMLAPALGFFPPVMLLWSFASFAWIVVFYFVKTEGGLDRRPAQIALVISVAIYLFSKLFLVPAVLFYAPFLDRLPDNLHFVTVLGTPLFTLLASLGALWLYFRRIPYRSLFVAWLIIVFTDAMLSLIIYVPGWLAQ